MKSIKVTLENGTTIEFTASEQLDDGTAEWNAPLYRSGPDTYIVTTMSRAVLDSVYLLADSFFS